LQALFYDEKDRLNAIPCFLIQKNFFQFLTANDKYTYNPTYTRHFNGLQINGDIALAVHVPGHWLISIISFVSKQILVLDPINSQFHSTQIVENLKRFVIDEYNNSQIEIDINEWTITTTWSNISMQTNGYSCGVFGVARLKSWFIHRRFPTIAGR
jgi:hypothetical protein